jgi:uncharacterized protein DUF1259
MLRRIAIVLVVGCFVVGRGDAAEAPAPALDTARIEQLTGVKGQLDAASGTFKVSVPRTDLDVAVAGTHVPPGLGLTSWAGFVRAGDHTVVMGDLVLLEGQVNLVMSAALDAGLEVTALHNHFLLDSPKVMFMHIGGMGAEADLATAVGKVFAKIRETSGAKSAPPAAVDTAHSSLDAAALDSVLGVMGATKDGVYKVVVGRSTQMDGHAMGGAMGINTWAAFAGSDASAVVDGDVAMLPSEVQPVLKALCARGIQVVALHNHMTDEDPRLFFVHYWGTGPAADLARAVRAALDLTRR